MIMAVVVDIAVPSVIPSLPALPAQRHDVERTKE